LIDYKLKRDLLSLFSRIESALTYERLHSEECDDGTHTGRIPDVDLSDKPPRMEAPVADAARNGHPKARTSTRKATADRGARARNTTVPDFDKPVGT
jgi:hypothetical protein